MILMLHLSDKEPKSTMITVKDKVGQQEMHINIQSWHGYLNKRSCRTKVYIAIRF